jgi:two-component system, cell cycle sensor histidine kinase and response regulator CckA
VDGLRPHVKTWENMVHPEDLSQTLSQLNTHLEGKTSVYVARNRLKMKNGKWRSNIDAGRVVERDEKNNPTKMEGIDITLE